MHRFLLLRQASTALRPTTTAFLLQSSSRSFTSSTIHHFTKKRTDRPYPHRPAAGGQTRSNLPPLPKRPPRTGKFHPADTFFFILRASGVNITRSVQFKIRDFYDRSLPPNTAVHDEITTEVIERVGNAANDIVKMMGDSVTDNKANKEGMDEAWAENAVGMMNTNDRGKGCVEHGGESLKNALRDLKVLDNAWMSAEGKMNWMYVEKLGELMKRSGKMQESAA